MEDFVKNDKWLDETNLISPAPIQPTPVWEPSDNLSNLVVVPLEETNHKLLTENYLQFTTQETRGISKKVTVEYKKVTDVSYQFCVHDTLLTGNPGMSEGWNIMSDLNVEMSTSGVSNFHIMDKIIPLTKTSFKKNTVDDSPFPNCQIAWYTVDQLPEVHVHLNEPGDVKITYDKIYTPRELSNKMLCQQMKIPLEDGHLLFNYGSVSFEKKSVLKNYLSLFKNYLYT